MVFLCDFNRWQPVFNQTVAISMSYHHTSWHYSWDIDVIKYATQKIIKDAIIVLSWCVVVQYSNVILMCLHQGCTNCTKILERPLNSVCQEGDMKQVPCWRSTNIRHHHTNCSQHSDLAPGFVHPCITFLFTHFPDLQNNDGFLSEVTLKSEI